MLTVFSSRLTRVVIRAVPLSLLVILLAAPLCAQRRDSVSSHPSDSAHTSGDSLRRRQLLKAVTITASPVASYAPSNALHLDPVRLANIPSTDAWDLLRQAAGIEVHLQGQGPGFASNASVRGFSSDHSTDLALWIDGVPINEPINGHAEGYSDWSLLFPQVVSGVDVTRGPTNVLFGNFNLSGAVNVQTLERLSGSRAVLQGGSFGLADATVLTGFDHGAAGGGVVGVRAMRQDGFRPNSGNNLEQFHARVTRDLSRSARIDGGVELYDAHWRSPGFLSEEQFTGGEYNIVSNTSDQGHRQRAQERVSLRVIAGSLLWRTTAYATQSQWQLFLTIPPAGGRFEGSGSQTEEEDHRKGVGLTSAATWDMPHGEITFGGETRWDASRYENYFTTTRRRDSTASALDARQISGGVFASYDAPVGDRVHLSLGVRADALSTTSLPDNDASVKKSHAIVSPKLGALARVTDAVSVFGNFSRGFRSTDGVISDPTLPLIDTWATEGGVKWSVGAASATLTAYRMTVSNEQTFDPLTRGSSSGGKSRRRGLELDWSLPVSGALSTHGSWSLNDAVYTARVVTGEDGDPPVNLTGLRVYNTARYVGAADVVWSGARDRWLARAGGTWLGSYAPFDEPGVVLGGYGLLHLSGRVHLGAATSLDLSIRNALDRRYPELVAGHIYSPGQPRTLNGGVTVAF